METREALKRWPRGPRGLETMVKRQHLLAVQIEALLQDGMIQEDFADHFSLTRKGEQWVENFRLMASLKRSRSAMVPQPARKKVDVPLSPLSRAMGMRRGRVDFLTVSPPAPRRRWSIGQIVNISKKGSKGTYEVTFAFRLKDDPSEWIYCLEERPGSSVIVDLLVGGGVGDSTPRVVDDVFLRRHDVDRFFADIPCRGKSRMFITNRDMMKYASEVR